MPYRHELTIGATRSPFRESLGPHASGMGLPLRGPPDPTASASSNLPTGFSSSGVTKGVGALPLGGTQPLRGIPIPHSLPLCGRQWGMSQSQSAGELSIAPSLTAGGNG
jgi:hypothetical protein